MTKQHNKEEQMDEQQTEVAVAYIHGRVEAQLEAFARSLQIPTGELAERLGVLLLSAEGGEILGTLDSLPTLPEDTGPAKVSKQLPKVEVARHAPSDRARSLRLKAYWNNMTPTQRSAEVRRRNRVRRKHA